MPKAMLPDKQTFRVIGIDTGSIVFGISELELRYKYESEEFQTLARLLDFYSFKVHSGAGWEFNRRLVYIASFFSGLVMPEGNTGVAYIEEVPHVRSITTHAELSQIVGVIKLGLLKNGWAVNMVNNKTWKAQVIGNGNAKKEQIREWATGGNIPADPSEMNEDNLDALCIGYFGITRLANQLRFDVTRQRAFQKLMWD